MKKIVLTFGLISGSIVLGLMLITMPLLHSNTMSFENGELVGYTSMVIAFSMIFFGVRSYRENHLGGVITFGKGLQVGLLITLIASLSYAIGWEFYFNLFAPDFMDKYAETCVNRAMSGGASEAEIQKISTQMAQMKEWYKNPVIRFGITLMEIFPVGLGISLLTAAVLHKRNSLPTQNAPA